MIKKIRNLLVLILFLQLSVFAFQSLKSVRPDLSSNNGFPFESIDFGQVKELEIKDNSGLVKFEKIGPNWFFKINGERARSAKIEELFAKIKSIKIIESIINSEATSAGFRIGDDDYNKKIKLTSAEPLVIYFKNTDMTGRSFIRIAGRQQVYEVDFAVDNLTTDPELWVPRGSQQNQRDSVSR